MNKLRPSKLKDIIGQKESKDKLDIIIKAAKMRGCSVPHVLFHGPSGTGKSTLSLAVANELGSSLHSLNAGNINSPKDILPTILKLQSKDVLFIDEIHRLNIKTCEMLYTIMEDFVYTAEDGTEEGINLKIPRFTMIGATTEAGTLPKPMLDRFVYKSALKLYSVDDLSKIIEWCATKLDIGIEEKAALNLAKRSRGTPRIANNLILWMRDFVQSKGSEFVSNDVVDEATKMIAIDSKGFTEADRKYMEVLKKSKRPMGLKTLVDSTNIDEDSILNIVEPFLIREGLIQRTSKGRVVC